MTTTSQDQAQHDSALHCPGGCTPKAPDVHGDGCWFEARALPIYRAGPYDERCRKGEGSGEPGARRCYRIWDHAAHGLGCAFDAQRHNITKETK